MNKREFKREAIRTFKALKKKGIAIDPMGSDSISIAGVYGLYDPTVSNNRVCLLGAVLLEKESLGHSYAVYSEEIASIYNESPENCKRIEAGFCGWTHYGIDSPFYKLGRDIFEYAQKLNLIG